MIPALARQAQSEEACEHNGKKQQAGCPKPTPGKVGGGCSFDGAYSSLVPVTDAAHVVHGPSGCLSNSWNNRGAHSSGPLLYRTAFTSALDNNDIVFGGEKRLYQAIKQVITTHRPPAVFVYQTCVTAMIGDDLQALCQALENKYQIPVIPVEAPGFIGTKNFGNRLAGEAVLKYVVGRQEPATEHPFNINLIGEFNIAGEYWYVSPLFDRLGIRVIACFSGDSRFHQLAMMHRSNLNMMVCSRALINVARGLEEQYGTPYFEGSFYGAANTSQALRTMAQHFGDQALSQRTEALIAEEEARIRPLLAPCLPLLQGKRVLLYTGGVKSWSLVGALQELGMEVVATGTRKSTEEDKKRIKDLMGDKAILIEQGSADHLLELYRDQKADLLMAGGRNQYTAIKARIPFVHVNQERDVPFAGYQGFVKLAQTLAHALTSPAFALAKQPFAPEVG